MNVLVILGIILALAFLVETLIEFLLGQILADILPEWKWRKYIVMYSAVAASVALAFVYQFDVLYLLSEFVGAEWQTLSAVSVPGMIITGVAIGKGSNYLHDFLQKYFIKPTGVEELPGGDA